MVVFENTQGMFEAQQPVQQQPVANNTQDFSVNDLFGMPAEQEQGYEDPLTLTNTQEQKPVNNDEVRFQYWQSVADKERNARMETERKLAEYEAKLANQNQAPQPVNEQQPVEAEKFPDFNVPEPQMPAGFNYQDAYNDPNSMSAQYLTAKANYDKNLRDYQSYRLQYIEAVNEEKIRKMADEFNSFKSQITQRQQYEAQINAVINDVKTKYGVSEDQARNFVNFMSDNNNFNLDNMFKFYQQAFQPTQPQYPLPGGQQAFYPRPGYSQANQMAPSPEFMQMRNAQSVPLPMGVPNPGSATNNNEGPGRSLLKSLILEAKQKQGLFGN